MAPSISRTLFAPVAASEPISDIHYGGRHGAQLADAASETLQNELHDTHNAN
jgi:hypothetical protein